MTDTKSSWNSLTDKKAPRKLGKREKEGPMPSKGEPLGGSLA